ncbi:MAG TPA: phosphate ABC transporter permease subunit PstC, partial [Pseudogracilibacillus sp.]|nr:phosphate ABC transporter permease subunit PstC [Pseudogracilibacillus sp.]
MSREKNKLSVRQLIEEKETRKKWLYRKEKMLPIFLLVMATTSFITTVTIVVILLSESFHFFREVSFIEFFTGTVLKPMSQNPQFGIVPLLVGTLTATGIALAVAVPIGLLTAIYLSEYASNQVRNVLKPTVEVLAGIPTIVYGFFAFTFVTPLLQHI